MGIRGHRYTCIIQGANRLGACALARPRTFREVLARVNLHFLELPDWLFRFSSLAGEIGVADCGRLQGSFGRHFECARVRISVGTLGSATGDSRRVRDGLRAITKRFGARRNPRRTMRSEDTTKCSSNDFLFTCSDTAVPRKVRYCTERRRAQLCVVGGVRHPSNFCTDRRYHW